MVEAAPGKADYALEKMAFVTTTRQQIEVESKTLPRARHVYDNHMRAHTHS